MEIDRYTPPLWLRLSLRRADLRTLEWHCGFCVRPTVVSQGGDGVSIDVRSADGPGCAGGRARVTRVGLA